MKKIISFVLSFVIMISCLAPMQIFAEEDANIAVVSVAGANSQIIDVNIKASSQITASILKLVVEYDERLTLVSVTNSNVFQNMSSKVYGNENGSFTYLGFSDGTNDVSVSADTTLFTLKFKVPDNANINDKYVISIVDELSEITDSNANLKKCASSAGEIAVTSNISLCASHIYGDENVVREASYIYDGFKYKICSTCGFTSSESTPAIDTNILKPIGTAIRYGGNPTGIGGEYFVNEEAIKALESNGYTVEISMELIYGDRKVTKIFYGNNAPYENVKNMSDGKISACVEGINSSLQGTISAYVKVTDNENSIDRVHKIPITLNGSEKISIYNVVEIMDISRYQPSSQEYLNSVLNGAG